MGQGLVGILGVYLITLRCYLCSVFMFALKAMIGCLMVDSVVTTDRSNVVTMKSPIV